MSDVYDIIIVGAGIAGLYSAYKIKNLKPETKLLVIEKNKAKYIGGRMGQTIFQGEQVVTGAGVGRKEKDKLLISLLDELKIPSLEFPAKHFYASNLNCNVKKTFLLLKQEYKKMEHNPKNTFKEFATEVLGKEQYLNFITCSGYTDYEHEDIYDTLYNYGFEDNYDDWTGLSIDWQLLIDALVDKIDMKNIVTFTTINSIKKSNLEYYTLESKTKTFISKKVILATTIDSVLNLLPEKRGIYKQIHRQPFLRTYGKFTKSSLPFLQDKIKGMTMVKGSLQKILPINVEKGIYMISYSDNKCAESLKPFLENNEENRDKFCNLVEKALDIPSGSLTLIAIKSEYWEIGTHYYEPLDKKQFKNRKEFIKTAQCPMHGIYVVGELVAINQGWIEGALESVENIIKNVLK
jgi:hypothetical protein